MKRKYSMLAPHSWEVDLSGKHGLPKYITRPIAELKAMVLARYPSATFKVVKGLVYDIDGIHLYGYVDVDDFDDLDDVRETVLDRVCEMQNDDDLPIWFHAEVAPERYEEAMAKNRANRHNPVK
jgi:hypothetical protein